MTTSEQTAAPAITVPLRKPLTYGKTTLQELAFRRLTAGQLRGLKLAGLLALETTVLIAIAARACSLHITPQQLEQLSARDLREVSEAISVVLSPPADAAATDTTTETRVQLLRPMQTAAGAVTALDFREPLAGDLRGLKLTGAADLDVDFILTLGTRCALQRLEPGDLDAIDAADLIPIAAAINRFFA